MRYVSILLLIVCFTSLTSSQSPTDTTITIKVTRGWNLISLPVRTSNTNVRVLFPTAVSKAFTYNRGYVAYDNLDNGKGYWLKFSTTESITITGEKITGDTIDVPQGWSMLGSISVPVDSQNIVTIPQGIIRGIVGVCPWFDCIVTTIRPGNAYWLKTSAEGKIILKSN